MLGNIEQKKKLLLWVGVMQPKGLLSCQFNFLENKEQKEKKKNRKAYFVSLYCGSSLRSSSHVATGRRTAMLALLFKQRVYPVQRAGKTFKIHLTCFWQKTGNIRTAVLKPFGGQELWMQNVTGFPLVKYLLSAVSVLLICSAKTDTKQQDRQHSVFTFALSRNSIILLNLLTLHCDGFSLNSLSAATTNTCFTHCSHF